MPRLPRGVLWLQSDEALMNVGRPLPSGRVGQRLPSCKPWRTMRGVSIRRSSAMGGALLSLEDYQEDWSRGLMICSKFLVMTLMLILFQLCPFVPSRLRPRSGAKRRTPGLLLVNPTLTNWPSEHGEQQAPISCGKPFRGALIPWSSVLIASILMLTAMVASSGRAAAKANLA